jgi:hypothetical protein
MLEAHLGRGCDGHELRMQLDLGASFSIFWRYILTR